MSEVTKPILLDSTGQEIVAALADIKDAIRGQLPVGDPVRITIVTPPIKTEYNVGDTLDLTGIVVSAVFTNNFLFDITDQCTFTPANGSTLNEVGDNVPIVVSWTWNPTGQTFTATQNISVEVEIVSWADGTDEQISRMLAAHYAGQINIHDYWSVGDTREVTFTGLTGLTWHEELNQGERYDTTEIVPMVLANEGGKELVNPINGHTECAFVVQMGEYMMYEYDPGEGQQPYDMPAFCVMNFGENTDQGATGEVGNEGGWDASNRRTWCNTTLRNALPNTLRDIFKLHKNYTGNGIEWTSEVDHTGETIISQDYFALPSEKELFGSCTYSNPTTEQNNSQFEYFENSNNRVFAGNKTSGNTISEYYLRSPVKSNTITSIVTGTTILGKEYFCSAKYISGQGVAADYEFADQVITMGAIPFGVI